MTEDQGWTLAQLHTVGVGLEFLLAAAAALVLLFVVAPYGRHERAGWGPTLPARLGWIVMESPAVVMFGWFFFRGPNAWQTVPLVFLAMWQVHYVHRTFIFPFRLRNRGKRMPLLIAALAFTLNTLNAWVNATWLTTLGDYPDAWMLQATTVLGIAMFVAGLGINLWADTVLLNLRRDGQGGYQIPRGGLYEVVSCPNYLGELMEWLGWAIATWSTAGLAFFFYAATNLVPRALANHAWYRDTFPDYPERRKALIPFLY